MEDKKKELVGLIKEQAEAAVNKEIGDLKEKLVAAEEKQVVAEEAQAKYLEDNKEVNDKLDAMQEKLVTVQTKTAGVQQYVFKGYDPELSKNFKSALTEDESNAVAKSMIDQIKGRVSGDIFSKTYDASNAIPVQYGNAVMGLSELSSVALQYANVIVADSPSIKLPTKGTREAVDSQSPGTANAVGQQTIGQLTWTIDKIVGTYIELLTTQIDDANFDIVNQIIVPMQAEAVGQNFDTEMFNGGEFTTAVVDASAGVTVSGSVAMAAAMTYDNINTMFYALEWERILGDPKWFGSRAAIKAINKVQDGDGRYIFMEVPINGKPSQTLFGAQYVVVPTISDTPANGAIRLAFGDPRHYTIFVRGGTFVSMVNPYIKMKEHTIQFICTSRADGNISDHATASSSGAWTTMLRTDA